MANEKNYVSYEDFGAKGDSQTDDFLAIYNAHLFANEKGLPVKGDAGKVYYLGKSSFGKTVPVYTSVDFCGATFIIDDSILPPYMNERGANVFKVMPTDEALARHIPEEELSGKSLRVGDKNLGFNFPHKSLVSVFNNDRIFIRHGPNKASSQKRELLIVNEDGSIDESTPVMWDYPEITAIEYRSLFDEAIVVENGTFITVANRLYDFTDEQIAEGWCRGSQYYYYGRGILVARSNTTVRSITHIVKDQLPEGGYPYAGWFYTENCANVLFENCKLTGHKAYITPSNNTPMGNYDTNLTNAINVTWRGCTQLNDISDTGLWGVMCSNFGRNLTYENCVLSRFDAHEGAWNVTIRNSTLGHTINVIGGGEILIENVKKVGASWWFLSLRPDYGSLLRGNVTIRNCEHVGNKGTVYDHFNIVHGNWINWNYGYECHMPTNVIIENFKYDADRAHAIVFDGATEFSLTKGEGNDNPLVPTKTITVKNQSMPLHLSKPNTVFYSLRDRGDLTVEGDVL